MPGSVRFYSGIEWEARILKLLRLRYALGEYEEIPAKHSGDFGLEAYSFDGCAFQCYAAEEPLSTKDLYEKQRDKISADIKKFSENKAELERILSDLKIRRWILVAPRFESARLLIHAANKSDEVKAANLPYAAEDFRIVVVTDDYFAEEIQASAKSGLLQLDLPYQKPEKEEVSGWEESHSSLVDTVDRKVSKIGTVKVSNRIEFRKELIRHFLVGQNALENLRKTYPDLYEEVARLKSTRESFLALETLLSTEAPSRVLSDAIKTFKQDLAHGLPGISDQSAQVLALEAASDWMLRCPLDFP